MASFRIIKSMIDTVQPQDRRRILAFIVREHPGTPEVMTRCSELAKEERELARLALVLGGESVRQQEELASLRAAIVFQATWKAVVTRRKFKVMLKGFKKLQMLYRDQSSSVTFTILSMAIFRMGKFRLKNFPIYLSRSQNIKLSC